MMIVWGHNNFRLKKVEPVELMLLDAMYNGITFERRQKYGHLFWIPIFPIGQMWVVKKKDGKMYHCPADIEARLNEMYATKVSIWAFTGPLLLLLAFVLYIVSDAINSRSWKKNAEEQQQKNTADLIEKVKNASANDYLLFAVKNNGDKNFGYQKYPLKVIKATTDSITLGTLAYAFSGQKSVSTEEDIVKAELDNNGIADEFTVNKKNILSAIQQDEKFNISGIKLPIFFENGYCLLTDIKHIEGPKLQQVQLKGIENDGKYFEFKNVGFNAKADSIIGLEDNFTWLLSKKRTFNNGDTIAIKCSGNSKAILYCSNQLKQIFTYKIDNTNYLKFEQLFKDSLYK